MKWMRQAIGGASAALVLGAMLGFAAPAAAENAFDATPLDSTIIAAGNLDNSAPNYGQELGNFYTYRIVATTKLNNGDILVSYDGRPDGGDSPSPNSILQRRSTDGGKTWGSETYVHAGHVDGVGGEAKYGYSDPSYVYDAEKNVLFNFHVYSKDAGFTDGIDSSDDADRNVVSAEVSRSTDSGETWTHSLITKDIDEPGMVTAFASSGHGIQLTQGAHRGRLVLQFAGRYTDGTIRAFSVFSDDHGATWQRGAAIGTSMNENKVVELADGTLMMNSRPSSSTQARLVAYSHDGGETWADLHTDQTLIDPSNNASIIRKHADADPSSREAQELLFSNTASTAARDNGTIRYSCDSGKTWPVEKVFESGTVQYTDLVAIDANTYGIFYESADRILRFATFDDSWLKPFCANVSDTTVNIAAGETTAVQATVTNTDTATLPAGTATVRINSDANAAAGASPSPTEWSATTVNVPALAPGQATTVTVNLTAPATIRATQAANPVSANLVVTAGDITVRGDVTVNVTRGTAVDETPDPAVLHSCVGTADGNLVTNCDFESANADGEYGSEWAQRSTLDGSVRVASETLADGTINHFGLIGVGGFDAYLQQRIHTEVGKTYTFSADVRMNATEGYVPSGVYFTAKGWNSETQKPNQGSTVQLEVGQLNDAVNWTRKSVTFVARNDLTDIGVIKWAVADAEGHVGHTTIAIDNVNVVEGTGDPSAATSGSSPSASASASPTATEVKPSSSGTGSSPTDEAGASVRPSGTPSGQGASGESGSGQPTSGQLPHTGFSGAVAALAAVALITSGLLLRRRRG